MSQWEEDFPDDEMMMASPKHKLPPASEIKEEEKTGAVPSDQEIEEGKNVATDEAATTPSETRKDDNIKPTSPEKGLPKEPAPSARSTSVSKPLLPSKNVPKVLVEVEQQEPKSEENMVEKKIPNSDNIINEQESRMEAELHQLLIDIRRIGEEGKPHVTFGELFDDDQVANYYEALVGTLKSAKKRKLIDFKGQMLLKGAHDNVVITIAGE